MKSPSQAAVQSELNKLKLDVDVHHRQMGGLWSADPDMLMLLKAEQAMLTREIDRLKLELKGPANSRR